MSGPVAVVTGGARGLGWAIGQRLLADGYTVIAGRSLTPERLPARSIEWARARHPRPGAGRGPPSAASPSASGGSMRCVNNAGIQLHRPIEDLEWAEWASVVDVNLHGTFACLQAGGRIMLEAGHGAIVNITSVGRPRAGRARAVRDDQGRASSG